MEYRDKAIIVGVSTSNIDIFDSMEELLNLATACHIEVVGSLTQKLNRINVSHYIGTGKVSELKSLVKTNEADAVIFDDELTPTQIRNLEGKLDCRVLDRTVLILDIFDRRAKTREAQLQVEIARLQYMLPRLVGSNDSLGRQVGGSGVYNKGSGEKKIELDRRGVRQKIKTIEKELADLAAKRRTQRKQRKRGATPTVALVGYTNAGKSTVMNTILSRFNPQMKSVFEKDMLFATLETTVRSIKFPDNKAILLTDTVGFISKLPHHLVKAFRSTLEEVIEADLLIHVVDRSNPDYLNHIKVTEETIKDLGADEIPTLLLFNKIDLMDELERSENIYASAKNGDGIDDLILRIKEEVFKNYVHCEMLIPYDKGEVLSHLMDNAKVTSTSYENEGTLIKLECKDSDYSKYKEYVV